MVRLRTNSKFPGEMTPRRAARILGVHPNTVYRWCQEAADERGPLNGAVRKSVTGWYYIESDAIEILLGRGSNGGKPA